MNGKIHWIDTRFIKVKKYIERAKIGSQIWQEADSRFSKSKY